MSKKLLSEAQIRRFQSLANLPVVNERKYGMEEEEMKEERYGMGEEMSQRAEEERDAYMKGPDSPEYKAYVKKYDERPRVSLREKEHGMKEDGHMEEDKHKMKEDMHDDAEEKEEMEPMGEPGGDLDLTEEEAQVIIELGKKLEGIMGAEAAGGDMEGEAEPMDMPDLGEELMEALAGVKVQPSRKEVVEEVARRVARRLNEAKRAQRRLNRALGNK